LSDQRRPITDIAAQLEIHAKQELDHALILSRQIDYLGKMPVVTPEPVGSLARLA
jgi:bacterioferritin